MKLLLMLGLLLPVSCLAQIPTAQPIGPEYKWTSASGKSIQACFGQFDDKADSVIVLVPTIIPLSRLNPASASLAERLSKEQAETTHANESPRPLTGANKLTSIQVTKINQITRLFTNWYISRDSLSEPEWLKRASVLQKQVASARESFPFSSSNEAIKFAGLALAQLDSVILSLRLQKPDIAVGQLCGVLEELAKSL